jgi:hypothetical protein
MLLNQQENNNMNLTSSQKQALRKAQLDATIAMVGLDTLVNDFNRMAAIKSNGIKPIKMQTAIRYQKPGSAANPPFMRYVATISKSVF